MICVSIKPASLKKLVEMQEAAECVADILEIRVDSLDQLPQVLKKTKIPIILTLRSVSQGGDWKGNKKETEQLLESLAALHPDYLDVEYTMPKQWLHELKARYPNVQIIISYHNFEETPEDLESILQEMQTLPGNLYKMVTMAKSILDAMRMMLFSKQIGERVIAFTMGKDGDVTRILSPIVNNLWAYAALDSSCTTAPGQLTVKELRETYYYASLTPNTTICGLIGDPVTFSIGHITHNQAYRSSKVNAVYVKMRVLQTELKPFLSYAKELGFLGLSVTMPLKEAVLPYIYEIDPSARSIGAVNTLTFSDKGIMGRNTDAKGALDALEQHGSVKGKTCAILGAGGAARAIAYEAKKRGANVHIFARRLKPAQTVADSIGVFAHEMSVLKDFHYDIFVNTTPSTLPIDPNLINSGTIVMDIKVLPKEIDLLVEAKKRGCICLDGKEMFYRQALGQMDHWGVMAL